MRQEDFFEQVWVLVQEIPCGSVTTYGELAKMLGHPGHSRLVGRAMRYAPEKLPCHRVVNSAGRCAPHWPQQPQLLRAEGVPFLKSGRVDLTRCLWQGL